MATELEKSIENVTSRDDQELGMPIQRQYMLAIGI